MRRRLPPHQRRAQPPPAPQKRAKPWWRPLTNRWGIFGLIIFIGLAMSLIDNAARWVEQQLAATPAPQPPIAIPTSQRGEP